MHRQNNVKLNISGVTSKRCQAAIDIATQRLANKLDNAALSLVCKCTIRIASGLISGGGQTNAEAKEIILDRDKNKLSLQKAEDFLVENDILNLGDWAKALPREKHKPWTCLTYQLIHEAGHLIDGSANGDKYNRLSPSQSPTKYGQSNASEAFAEAFAYWVFDVSLKPEVEIIVKSTLNRLQKVQTRYGPSD